MENASNALMMAGGILLALLILSLLVFTFNIINRSENAKTDQKMIQEAQEFNKKFLAFEKSSMYGTDVISILGLAISNNETYNQSYTMHPDGRYDSRVDGSVNVEFTLLEPVTAITREYNYTREWNTETRQYDIDWVEDESNRSTTPIFEKNKKYSLELKDSPSSLEKKIFDNIIAIAVNGNNAIDVKTVGTKRIVTDGSGFNEFKKRIFECAEIKYNQTGKINYMCFKEKDTTN